MRLLAALLLLAAQGCVEPPNQLSGPEAFPVAMAAAAGREDALDIVLTERRFEPPVLNAALEGRMLQLEVSGYHPGWGTYPVKFYDSTPPHAGEALAILRIPSRSRPIDSRVGLTGQLQLGELPDGGLQGRFSITLADPDGGDPRELSGRFAAERGRDFSLLLQ